MRRLPFVRVAILFEGGLAIVALALGAVVGVPAFGAISTDPAAAGWGMLAAAPLLLGLVQASRTRGGALGRINRVLDTRVVPLFSRCTVAELALVSLAAGIGEETLFRGVLQPWLSGLTSPAIGLLAASALFGLAHLVTPAYAVIAAVVGAYLGSTMILTENLLTPIVTHALYDFAALLWLVRFRSA